MQTDSYQGETPTQTIPATTTGMPSGGAASGGNRAARGTVTSSGSTVTAMSGTTAGTVLASGPPGTTAFEKKRKRTDANRFRALLVGRSPEFLALAIHPWAWYQHRQQHGDERTGLGPMREDTMVSGNVLLSQLRRLQRDRDLDSSETEVIFSQLEKGLHDEEALQALLTLILPDSLGGLSVIAVGLLHPNKRVKRYAALLLRRLESFPSTAPAAQTLNKIFRGALNRQDTSSL